MSWRWAVSGPGDGWRTSRGRGCSVRRVRRPCTSTSAPPSSGWWMPSKDGLVIITPLVASSATARSTSSITPGCHSIWSRNRWGVGDEVRVRHVFVGAYGQLIVRAGYQCVLCVDGSRFVDQLVVTIRTSCPGTSHPEWSCTGEVRCGSRRRLRGSVWIQAGCGTVPTGQGRRASTCLPTGAPGPLLAPQRGQLIVRHVITFPTGRDRAPLGHPTPTALDRLSPSTIPTELIRTQAMFVARPPSGMTRQNDV
ncbi:hypothetical protein EV192_104198 [Actinocrispum wychmicini]|uniref:Uncharacterized protein n=1 Tax=Actinocrispum wychmicini TaxID=1213861 RepID=A0A4R2JKK8_9PSEU|nr:hypothetical protein EV192_104198 [Actinocrispum wychmicini]